MTVLELDQARAYIKENSIWMPFCGCWIWIGAYFTNAYGSAVVNRKQYRAHRLTYLAFKGPIPKGMCVCHRCDTKNCVNPDHLFLGTIADNNRDMTVKGRQVPPRGEKHWAFHKGHLMPLGNRFECGKANPMFGKKYSAEEREKISKALIGNKNRLGKKLIN